MLTKSVFLVLNRIGVQRVILYRSMSTIGTKYYVANSTLQERTSVHTKSQVLYSGIPNQDIKNQKPKVAKGSINSKETNTKNTSTRAQKLKKAVAEYGTTVMIFHISISLISLGSCYLLVSSGLDVKQVMVNLGLNEWVKGNSMLVSNAGTFAVAYAVHKVFAPVRISITLASVPFIVRYLRQKGILKK